MRKLFELSLLSVLVVSTTASAQLATRCFQDDQLVNTTLAGGRNAWSRKCGYISVNKETFLNGEGEYQVYSGGCYSYPNIPAGSDCHFYVPVSESDACIAGLVKLGTCVTGCYTASEKIAFGGGYWPISDAYAAGIRTVTTLTKDATLDNLTFGEQDIRTYVASKEEPEDVFSINTVDGRHLEVTSEHPLVNSDGYMVKAKTLKEGDQLLGTDGKPVEIATISVFKYEGKTWNVQPVSHEKIENVLSVKGLLTGSVRFQNEWADDHFRLSLRDEVDTSGL